MLIGVVSDTHGNLRAVAEALRVMQDREVECVLHCGDIDTPETVELFTAPPPAHFVLGNCDLDAAELHHAARNIDATLHGRFADLELAGKRVALVHGDDQRLMADMEKSDRYDYLFYGHTHQPEEHRTGRTLVMNPGALYRARPKTFVILNLKNGRFERIIVGE